MISGTELSGSSKKNKRVDSDYYATPSKATQALIDTGLIPGNFIWEPACGNGHMSKVLEENGYNVLSTDINQGYGFQQNFLDFTNPLKCDAIITNPPFSLSVKFIETAFLHDTSFIAFLLKSQYWHASSRISLFNKYPPAYIMPLTWRLDFCFGERGGAPTMECLWTVWIKGRTDTKYRQLKRPEDL